MKILPCFSKKLKKLGIWISGIALIGMMLFLVTDVVLRNAFNNSIKGGFEIVQNYFMPLAVFPALAYVYSAGVLPKMGLLIDCFKEQTIKSLLLLWYLLKSLYYSL